MAHALTLLGPAEGQEPIKFIAIMFMFEFANSGGSCVRNGWYFWETVLITMSYNVWSH